MEIHAGEKEYGKCREEPLKDEMGRDIVIPKLFTQWYSLYSLTREGYMWSWGHPKQIFAPLFKVLKISVEAFRNVSLEEDGRLLAQPLIICPMEGWRRGEHGRLELGDNDQISKIVPQKLNHIPDQDIIQFVKP
ncbi:hypothetical protein IGI04_006471 [Brassica rapa subsp. trilocularis]|uniref:Uncharacterized protein n=1 Tax=Brassica rapa subsp. trilocularis TaxID=1813537 RepID=A0ABQ7NH06_BRACM|nr:hypothetical protein IGI04_006471 [Brassica rapa subsp. trilocularis]